MKRGWWLSPWQFIPRGAAVRTVIGLIALAQGIARVSGGGIALTWSTPVVIGLLQIGGGLATLATTRSRLTIAGHLAATGLAAVWLMLASATLTMPTSAGTSLICALCLWAEAWSRRYDR